ncbi:MAG: hypothetical protein K9L30_14725 [Desulfobacterales bacterium]|nr:hypothetical protein [Desulfobacterales bacterium]
MDSLIAIPSLNSAGLKSVREERFDKCGYFTLVLLKKDQIADVQVIPNIPDPNGKYDKIIQMLVEFGVNVLISGVMRMELLLKFISSGIEVYYGSAYRSIHDTVSTLANGDLTPLEQLLACQGGCIIKHH